MTPEKHASKIGGYTRSTPLSYAGVSRVLGNACKGLFPDAFVQSA